MVRQSLTGRVAKLERAVYASPDPSEQARLLDGRQRLQERRGIVAPLFPATVPGEEKKT